MEGIVLAGGFGTRLREVVPDLPKPMAPVAGKPFLEILLSSLAKKGFTRVVLSLGFMADKITSHFGDHFAGIELVYEVESKPLGTGGAVRSALSRCVEDHAFIFNGDTYLDLEVDLTESAWIKSQNPIIVVREVPDVARFGSVALQGDRIQKFLEKGSTGSGLINAGCYVLPKDMLNGFELGTPFSLEVDFFASNIQRLYFEAFVTKGRFIDIGVPEDYARAQEELASL
jgi:D-glycero-alpha-D-manno-heptose 1-phosphate guanylyltransferase